MAKVLEDMGIPGKVFLQEALTNTSDPLGAIEEFQQDNSILLPSLQPALPLLDLHNLKRIDFHKSVFDTLRDCLLTKIAEISNGNNADSKEKLEAILDKSFPLISIDSLLPVSMCLLKHLPKVPQKYINFLIKNKPIYKLCPIEVKRQIWQKNQTLFGDEVLPLLTRYIKDKEALLISDEISINNHFFTSTPKIRRQSHIVKELIDMIGKNIRLYDMVLQFLRTLFLKTHNVHYCSLRAEILMALHDLEVNEVCSVDPCYKFTWCLDACIREKFVDLKRSRELQGFLDSVQKGHEQVLGDLSMILCDPFVVNTLLWSIVKIINDTGSKEHLPRESAELQLLIRMLNLGQHAWDIINKQVFKEPKMDNEIMTRFIPSLLSLGLVDMINSIKLKIDGISKKDEPAENKLEIDEKPSPKKKRKGSTAKAEPPKDDGIGTNPVPLRKCLTKFINDNQVCKIITMWHFLHLVKSKKRNYLLEVLELMNKSAKDFLADAVFISVLTAFFTTNAELLADEAMCQALFTKFLLVTKNIKDLPQCLILKLLTNVCLKIPKDKLKTILTRVEPKSKKVSDAYRSSLTSLKEKISTHEKQFEVDSANAVPDDETTPAQSTNS